MPKGVYKRNPSLRPQTFRPCKQCGKVFGPLRRLDKKYCSMACKAASQRVEVRRVRVTDRIARNAQRMVCYYLEKGKIKRPTTCQRCGCQSDRIEASHNDYARALDVEWLCRPCHVRKDRARPLGVTRVRAA